MNRDEVIKQLGDLKAHCQDYSEDEPWISDVVALDFAIKFLKEEAPEVEAQEQSKKFIPEDSDGICKDLNKCSNRDVF